MQKTQRLKGFIVTLLITPVLVSFFFCGHLSAQNNDGSPDTYTLDTGLPIAYFKDSTRKLTHFGLAIRTMSVETSVEKSHLAEHLFFEGEDSTLFRDGIRKYRLHNGIETWHMLNPEGMFFGVSCPDERFREAFSMFAACVIGINRNGVTFQRARAEVTVELQEKDLQPDFHFMNAFYEKANIPSGAFRNFVGTYSEMIRVSSIALDTAFRELLKPSNCLLIGLGNADENRFFQVADSLLFDWREVRRKDELPIIQLRKEPVKFIHENAWIEKPVMLAAWQIPSDYNDIADFFAWMANNDRGSIKRLVVDDELIREGHWDFRPSATISALIFSYQPAPGQIRESQSQLERVFKELTVPFFYTKEELEWACDQQNLRLGLIRDDSRSRLANAAFMWINNHSDWWKTSISIPEKDKISKFFMDFVANVEPDEALFASTEMIEKYDYEKLFLNEEAVVTTEEPELIENGNPEEEYVVDYLAPEEIRDTIKTYRIYFKSNSFEPDDPSIDVLHQVADFLTNDPDIELFLNGFADSQGDGVYNYQLSLQRAEAVKDFLMTNHQISPERLVVRGFGEAFPEFPEKTPALQAKNRRVTFEIMGGDQ